VPSHRFAIRPEKGSCIIQAVGLGCNYQDLRVLLVPETPMNQPDAMSDRERLEQQLRQELEFSRNAYDMASAEFVRTKTVYADMLAHPDGTYALRQAAKEERIARQKYTRALKDFTRFILGPAGRSGR
jgi:hypothetical protein